MSAVRSFRVSNFFFKLQCPTVPSVQPGPLSPTPDVTHINQMALIARYVKVDNSEVQIKESFLNFFPLHRKNADEITKSILDELQQKGLDIMMCRGQAYDNASIMAGIRSGIQCRIKEVNSKAIFIPCANYSLYLAGVHAVAWSEHSATFLLLWKGSTPFFLLLLKDGKCYLSMYKLW